MNEITGEAMLEELLKVEPSRLDENTQKLFYTIMKVIDERDELQQEKEDLTTWIEMQIHDIKITYSKEDNRDFMIDNIVAAYQGVLDRILGGNNE